MEARSSAQMIDGRDLDQPMLENRNSDHSFIIEPSVSPNQSPSPSKRYRDSDVDDDPRGAHESMKEKLAQTMYT